MDTPFLSLFKAVLNGMSRCHFRRPLSKERTLAISEDARKRPTNRDTTKKSRPESNFKRKTIGFSTFHMKNKKKLKREDPCRRSATSLISGDAKKHSCQKAWSFCMGGVIKTEHQLLIAKKYNTKGVLKNCKDAQCKMTTFEETNANDIGCAK